MQKNSLQAEQNCDQEVVSKFARFDDGDEFRLLGAIFRRGQRAVQPLPIIAGAPPSL